MDSEVNNFNLMEIRIMAKRKAHTVKEAILAVTAAIRAEANGELNPEEKAELVNNCMDVVEGSSLVTLADGIDKAIELKNQIEDEIAAAQTAALDADQAELDDMQATMMERQANITARRVELTEQIEGETDTEEQEKPAEVGIENQ